MDEEIKQLKRRRDVLRNKMRDWDRLNRNAIEYAKEYELVINDLKKYGCKVDSKIPFVTVDYWLKKHGESVNNNTIKNIEHINVKSPKSSNTDISKIIKDAINEAFEHKTLNNIKLYEYTLNIAWTTTKEENKLLNYAINLIIKYLDEMDLKLQGIDTNDMVDKIEYIRKYEFRCTEDRFSTIKRSVQVLLDILTNDSLDIVVYGKPKNF